jgi:hypothetical protein
LTQTIDNQNKKLKTQPVFTKTSPCVFIFFVLIQGGKEKSARDSPHILFNRYSFLKMCCSPRSTRHCCDIAQCVTQNLVCVSLDCTFGTHWHVAKCGVARHSFFSHFEQTPNPNLWGSRLPRKYKEDVALQGRSFALPLIAIKAGGSLLSRVKGCRGQ